MLGFDIILKAFFILTLLLLCAIPSLRRTFRISDPYKIVKNGYYELLRSIGFGNLAVPLPPSLPKLPFIGNLLQIPKRSVWVTYKEWSNRLRSDTISLSVLGTQVIVLNSVQACTDLLDKRSSIYSCRQRMPMVTELMGWDSIFLFMHYGKRWREHRRLFEQEFNAHAVKQFLPQELKATRTLLRQLLDDPEGFLTHIRHMAGQTIMSITYGLDILPRDDPYLASSERSLRAMSKAAFPGRYLVDFLPALKYVPSWFPGAGFKRRAAVWKAWTKEMLETPYQVVKKQIAEGTAPPSFVRSRFEKLDLNGDIEEQESVIKCTSGTMYAGGADTTVSTTTYFFLAMLENPQAQRLAQAEIDRLVGSGRLPTLADEADLPYTTAIVKEVFRWGNVAPIAPHVNTQEDFYNGMRIPARSVVIANLWALLHNEKDYPQPESFKPERFLINGRWNPKIRDPLDIAFGFGRRICPGRHMAYHSVWIAIASILSVFDITKKIEDGKVIEPSGEYAAGIVCAPKNFRCTVTPRSAASAEIVRLLSRDF